MPATGRQLGPGGALDLGDPTVNLDVGVRYLRDLLTDFDGDLELALAAYNAGPAAVERFGGVPPYRETRAYLTRVLSTYVEHHRRVWEESGADELFELR
jgi:soluble lytic murein transglycosylase-like protein